MVRLNVNKRRGSPGPLWILWYLYPSGWILVTFPDCILSWANSSLLWALSCGLSLVGYVPLLRKVSFVWANSSLLLTGGIRWLSDKCIRPKQLQKSVAGFYSVGLTAGLKRYPGKEVVKCGVELWEG